MSGGEVCFGGVPCFFAAIFLLQSLRSQLKIPVLMTRLYAADIICSGGYGFYP